MSSIPLPVPFVCRVAFLSDQESEKDRNLLRFPCIRGSPLVSHLFFADDNLLFCKATVGSCEEIGRVLKVYEKGSGQMVNLQKSNIKFSPNVTQGIRDNIQAVFGGKWVMAKVSKCLMTPGSLAQPPSSRSPPDWIGCLESLIYWRLRKGDGMGTLEQNFMEVDRVEILSIPLGLWKPPDKLIWHFDKQGTYEVRSGKVVSAGLCQRCKKGAESVAHAVWWCDKADLVWSKTAFCGLRRRFKGLDCYEILKGLAEV
ncbi:hypothetical protein Dsin_008428 [Dipteronia sinensis]|uniref:Reverse transcriptase zinc-binding domain-containing protein n=1 Tax=Dipteronia sinensis TaxID=43782 RepID=A0AAE0AP60_9ROSI|nr:hypothetical protein Dsin_008428 [Dipteronia sinensis]